MPESMVSDSIGLCVSGCPPDNVLSIETETDATIRARIPDATKRCNERFSDVEEDAFVVQSRIKACIYDLAVTGDDSVGAFFLNSIDVLSYFCKIYFQLVSARAFERSAR